MAGRWVMASIQTSFAIMPAAVYWFGGLALASGSHAISIPMLVAFTTLQTRLFFPVGSLLGVGLDVQTSLALFDRIFEYLDQPVDIEEKPDALEVAAAGDVVFDHVWFRYGDELDARGRLVHGARRHDDRARRRDRLRQDDARLPRRAALRRRPRARHDRRRRRPRPDASRRSRDLVGVVSQETYLFHATVRENLRFAKPDATDEEIEAAAEAARIHDADRRAARGLRHGRRRARLPLLRRREAADRDRADDPAQPADPRARRGDELARHRDRAARAGGARPALRRAGRRSRSRTASRRSATPTRSSSSTTAASSRPGPHEELIVAGGRYAALVSRDAQIATSPPEAEAPALAPAS